MQKNTLKRLHKIPPPPGGFDLGFEKTLSYFCRLLWGKLKSAEGENFRDGTIFTPKIAQKMKKHANKSGGTDFGFNLGVPLPDYRKFPHLSTPSGRFRHGGRTLNAFKKLH